MPATPKPLRSQTVPIRKDKSSAFRRTSLQVSVLDAADPSSPVDRRRRLSSRAKDMRSASLPHSSSSFAGMGGSILVNGASTMPSSASSQSPDELPDAPRTKTGRISTAKKGKPVHRCDVCGKIYTRNEHLKRHQLNHSNKSISCDVARCKKKFQRLDLLLRHKEQEHDMPTANLSVGGSPSIDSQSALTRDASVDPKTQQPPATFAPSSRMGSGVWDGHSLEPSPQIPEQYAQDLNLWQGWGYDTNMFPMATSATADGFNQTVFDPTGSKSPASAASSAQYHWIQQQTERRRSSRIISPTSTSNSVSPFASSFLPNSEFDNAASYYEAQDNREDAIITTELGRVLSGHDEYGYRPHFANLDPRYLDAYWTFFDPIFSVVNRYTFEASDTAPLVKALMIAIGAYHYQDQTAQNLAHTLRETCGKLLQERIILDYNQSRLWDLQAIFLFEAFSVYCSRRPHGRFSQCFEDLFVGLISDRDTAYFANPLSMIDTATANMFGVVESTQRIQWVHLESKRRLLLACYMLEVQQKLFFGSHRPVSDKNLPLPCSKMLWEARTLEEWQYLTQQESLDSRSLSDALAAAYAGETAVTDSFLLNVAIAHSAHSAMMDSSGTTPIAPPSMSQTPVSLFSIDAAYLAVNSPVKELLAVSGETFVLGQKLSSRAQYHEVFENLHNWVSSEQSLPVLQSACRLFSIALQQDRVGLIYEDWALTLAALVFWACIMWPQQQKIQGRVSPLPPHGAVELAGKALAMANGQSEQAWQEGRAMSWGGARACLAFVRQRIDGRIGWLVQDACSVLGKLIDGRVIDDMSSSEEDAN